MRAIKFAPAQWRVLALVLLAVLGAGFELHNTQQALNQQAQARAFIQRLTSVQLALNELQQAKEEAKPETVMVPALNLSALALHRRLRALASAYAGESTQLQWRLDRGEALDPALAQSEQVSLSLEAQLLEWAQWQSLWRALQTLSAGLLRVEHCEFRFSAALSVRCQTRLVLRAFEPESQHENV